MISCFHRDCCAITLIWKRRSLSLSILDIGLTVAFSVFFYDFGNGNKGCYGMKIVTCIKYVPESVEKSDSSPTIKRDSAPGIINPLDLNAIEEAIRIKEKCNAHTLGVCMGVEKAADTLKYAVAMGLDEVVLLTDPAFAGSDTYVTSYILSMAIRKLGIADIILCGNQSTDGSTGQIPQEIAVHLGVPCIINVVSLQLVSEGMVNCTVATENGYYCVDVKLPAVIGILKEINEPRVPSISGLLKAQRTTVTKLGSSDITIDRQKCGLHASCTQIKTTRFYKSKAKNTKDITGSYIETIDDILSNVHANGTLQEKTPRCQRTGNCISGRSYKELWVICEIHSASLSNTAYQLLSKALSIAPDSYSVCAVILEQASSEIIDSLTNFGVDKIYHVNRKGTTGVFDEDQLAILVDSCNQHHPEIILFENSTCGRWLSASAAASLQTGLTADCIDLRIDDQTGDLVQTRVAFSGNIIADIVCSKHRPQMATVRNNVFEATPLPRSPRFEVSYLTSKTITNKKILPAEQCSKALLPSRLRQSDIVVCGGRGLGGKVGFGRLAQLASIIGAAVGATRVAVDAKWIDYNHQIGQTGITIKPKVYIAFGVSGAVEHTVGMDRADLVISVNIDRNASMNKLADYFIQEDCLSVIECLINYFDSKRKEGKL